MSFEGAKPYPGEAANAQQLLDLAEEFRRAAEVLRGNHRKRAVVSSAPFRLSAIHALELYLSAVLRASGLDPVDLRRLGHGLAQRVVMAESVGLQLKVRTRAQLMELETKREYLTSRYDPIGLDRTQLNRIESALNQVASKVPPLITRLTEQRDLKQG